MAIQYVQVYIANGMLDAEMIRSFLESANITCFLSQESAGTIYGLTLGPLGEVKVFVPEDKYEDARKMLDLMEQDKYNQENEIESEKSEDNPAIGTDD